MPPRDPYRYFRVEARELLDGLRDGVEALRDGADNAAGIRSLLRMAHTLKGAARVVRLNRISDLTHTLEEILSAARDDAGEFPAERRKELREIVAAAAEELSGIDRPKAGEGASPASVSAALPALDTVRLQVAEVNSVLSAIADLAGDVAGLRAEVEGIERASRQARLLSAVAGRAGGGREIAVRFQSDAGELADGLQGVRLRSAARLDRIERDLRGLREETSRLRLIPADTLWDFLRTAASDAARSRGKAVRLDVRCRTPRLDAPIFSGLQEALLHLVRNAVAHGIESPDVRADRKKPREGRVRIEVTLRGGQLRVVCSDDGGGLNVEAIRAAAAARGWSTANPDSGLAELVDFLFRGGLTTNRAPDEVSGRGVGLNAVRAAVTRIGGQLSVASERGHGTTVTIEVPLPVASIEALVAESGGVRVVIPLEAVRRVVGLAEGAVQRSAGRDQLRIDDETVFYRPLARLLPRGESGDFARSHAAVLIRGRDGDAALGVEKLCGVTEAAVGPLPRLADAVEYVCGTGLADGGAPQLLLAPDALVAAILSSDPERAAETVAPPPILVVDDSLTTRMLEQSILESAGYEVDLAVSGEEALERLRERRYGLMLVDVEMPGMDGFAVIERVRRDPLLRDLPVILVTSREAREDRLRGLEVGAQDYVVKGDFDQSRLLRRIRELLP